MALCNLLLLMLPWLVAAGTAEAPGCKIRITSKGLELVKQEGLRFVEQELEHISIPDLHGKEGPFHYNISGVKVTDLQLALSDLHFQPPQHLAFSITNGSISLRFRRQLLYWFLGGSSRGGCRGSRPARSCSLPVPGSSPPVGLFQLCPALQYAGRVQLNSLLDTVSVRSPVDEHISIDYSLLSHPVVSPDTLDLDFKGMFYHRWNETLVNQAVAPVIEETERMVYVAFSEYFFNSAMDAYYRAGVLSMEIAGEEVPKDLEVLLRATFFGSIFMLSPAVVDAPLKLVLQVSAPPLWTIKPSGTSVSVAAVLNISLVPVDHPAIQLSSMAMDARLSAKMSLRGKALQVQLDLRRFRIYSKQSALESLAAPLKTLLQLMIMPMLNERTKKGVPIPLPEGMDFTKGVVTSHLGFIMVGADLHFSKGLREVIEKYQPARASRPQSPGPTAQAGSSPSLPISFNSTEPPGA
uniref:Phospholipid transfer protein n=1 Tax=Chelydra serpentina TaxID=8475 RepID=A0A8C3XRA5_CHESE